MIARFVSMLRETWAELKRALKGGGGGPKEPL